MAEPGGGPSSHSSLRRDVPQPHSVARDPGQSPQDYEETLREWWRSEQAINLYKDEYRCEITFAEDGSFRIDDVPPGRYILTFHIHCQLALALEELVFSRTEVIVPNDPAVPSDEPLDLGGLKFGGL